MQAKDIMSTNVTSCLPGTSLEQVARMMLDHDCGAIPVVDDAHEPIGVITDRDIVCRAVAEGKNPLDLLVVDCMTNEVDTVMPDTHLDECCEIMERAQVRRLIVIDDEGKCCGVISQADIALKTNEHCTAEVLKEVSQPA